MSQKIFLSGLAEGKDWKAEISKIASKVKAGLAGQSCDLFVFFVSEVHKDFDRQFFSSSLTHALSCRVSIGCNSCGVIGDEKEVEMEPAISYLAMHLPGIRLSPFTLSGEETQTITTGSELINFLDLYPPDKPRFICLADPATCDMTKLLTAFNEGYKGLPVIGGLASGGVIDKPSWLCLNGRVYSEGACGVALVGDIEFDIIVSQGCRPIGKPYVITKAEDSVLYELAGKPTLEVLREVLDALPAKDKKLAEHSLFVGLVMNEQRLDFKRGDFLIRNIVGFEPDTGALMVGALLKVGHTVQFQLRDAHTSSEDLEILLEKFQETRAAAPQGGILVSCCGRGKGLYGEADHDVQKIQSMRGPLPLTGFFANGEIGPIENKNYVHGYTSSLVILR